jgi:hypothetical protein
VVNIDIKLTEQQEEEIKSIIKKMKEDDIIDNCKTNYFFANKCSTEEMMMNLSLSYK